MRDPERPHRAGVPYALVIERPASPSATLAAARAATALLPVAVAAAWIPVRSSMPNTTVALAVVVAAAVAAFADGRWVLVVAALAGTAAFDLFDTAPYGQLLITRVRDVVTALAVLAASLLAGEVCVRMRSYRAMADSRGADFAVMSAAAGLVAFGEDAAVVVRALAGELQSRLDLADCEFVYGPPPADSAVLTRSATERAERAERAGSAGEMNLPVWLGSQVVGYYRLAFGAGSLSQDRVVAALGIADQAGAALAASRPDEPGRGGRPRRLHPVR